MARASVLGVGGQPGRAVQIPRLSRRGGQRDKRSRLGAGIGDGVCLGVGGQPGRAVQIPGPSGCGGHSGQRSRLGAGIGDGAGDGLGAVPIPCLRRLRRPARQARAPARGGR